MNVTGVVPGMASRSGGSMVVLQVLGMPSSVLSGVFCGVGALGGSGSWSVSEGVVSASSGSVSCLLPAHGEGLNVVEVAVGRSGEMSRSGVQVEYAGVGSVTSVRPSMGVVGGGTVVTVGGSGFVAGRTACKFGSGSAVLAEVVSSVEALCVSPAGVRGPVALRLSMGTEEEAALVSATNVVFTHVGAMSVLEVSPAVTMVTGGSKLSVVVSGASDGMAAWCSMD